MRNILLGVAAFGLFACSPSEPKVVAPTQAEMEAEAAKLTTFLDESFEAELARSPERATRLGRKDNYGKLDDRSDAAQTAELEIKRKNVGDMKAQFDRAKLPADAQTYFDIWALELDRAEAREKFKRQDYVFGRSSPNTELPSFLITYHLVSEVSDYEALNSRLAALGPAMDTAVTQAGAAAAEGIRMPKFQYERVIRESRKMITGQPFTAKGADSPLWADAKGKLDALVKAGKATPEQAKTLLEGTRKAMVEGMKPGYERLVAWAEGDMANAPSDKVGAVTLKDGLAWYQAALFLQTTTQMTADEIHELGQKEVARIHGEMDKLAAGAGFADRKAFLADRDKHKDLLLPMTDKGRAEYLAFANAEVQRIRGLVPKVFNHLPEYGMEVQREPSFSEVPGGAAHASRATPDGSKPGMVFVHLMTPTGFIKSEITDLMCHEAVPGHLMQGDVAVRLKGVPKFKNAYGNAAFNEGWALYAERLCKEMGVYQDAYQEYAMLDGELWRAVRLVLDTGLHAKGWTQTEAEQYARENTSEDDSKIGQEVRRFLVNPGQATAYKVGQLTISRLRAQAETALGARFDVKAYNDMVIGAGGLPLPVLETRVAGWVEAQKVQTK